MILIELNNTKLLVNPNEIVAIYTNWHQENSILYVSLTDGRKEMFSGETSEVEQLFERLTQLLTKN